MIRLKAIEFKSVRLGYGRRKVFAALSLDIYEGDFLGIIGPNGSGKTTLLRSLMGLLKPQRGEIIRACGLQFGYCPQRQSLDTLFPFTVFEIVMMARTKIIGPLSRPDRVDKEKVLEALETAGILNLASERFYNLSGGQKQRTIIARALSLEPNFLVLDEPTTDLDIKAEREVVNLIKALHQKQKMTIALATHELNEVIDCARKFIFLKSGESKFPGAAVLPTIGDSKETKKNPYKIFTRDELSEKLLSEIFATPIKLKEIDQKTFIL
ncbi:ATP-binding cassette domain-containing protein [candidate division NPL-UPA2 bacterium]|nr:ATP-binding cassette domain-containing protein [candidate division NPL-UPA2 bacterium]